MFIPFNKNVRNNREYKSAVHYRVNAGRDEKKVEQPIVDDIGSTNDREVYVEGIGFIKSKDLVKRKLHLRVVRY